VLLALCRTEPRMYGTFRRLRLLTRPVLKVLHKNLIAKTRPTRGFNKTIDELSM
jgi:hypothetical protein